MGYTKASIQNLKDSINIVDVVGSVLELKRSGANYKGVCPFHKEKTASFNVNELRQSYYCFGCQVKGDVLEFVQKYYNLDFQEACEKLSKEYGIELVETGFKSEDLDKYYEINKEAAMYFLKNLTEKKNKGYPYMRNRGIKDQTIKLFGIGYAEESWDGLYKHLKSKGFEEKDMIELGLIAESKGKYYDKFRNRVMFPIINTRGKVIGFGGRAISDEDNPKYLNSPESKVFKKKDNLFGLNLARETVHKEDYIILVEGYMDVIGLYQGGIKNVSASLGTALTEAQANLIKRHAHRVILCYDSDNAGRAAALRGMEVLRAKELDVKVIHVTDGKDPDEFIRKNGKKAFLELLDNAYPFGEYKIDNSILGLDPENHQDRIKISNRIGAVLNTLSPAEAEEYATEYSKRLNISKAVLLRQADEIAKKTAPQSTRPKPKEKPAEVEKLTPIESELIRLILRNDEYLGKTLEIPEMIETDVGQRIIDTMTSCLKEDVELDTTKLLDRLDEEDRNVIYSILEHTAISSEEEKVFQSLLQRTKILHLQREVERINEILKYADESEVDSEEMKTLLTRSMELQKKILEEKSKEQNNG